MNIPRVVSAVFDLHHFLLLCVLVRDAFAIRCYQCSSKNAKNEVDLDDQCGAYARFDKSKNQPVDCNGDESVTPGAFCLKVTSQGPIGFIFAETGVTGVCYWGIDWSMNYWEHCYCSEDSCNHSGRFLPYATLIAASLLAIFAWK